ncbi:hypothetical protein [Amycolatopsis sp. Hca4]|uniref:hypothetical protein n=1 Tax=Amycolatopsis sp. Hca4 TaxID=2742131 RepID=UPI001592794A|nr:hypothetical protein [Amycolatopsis sp. Hca4]QKV73928.1 hypothetical protein HUT10_09205 [Amycolatopsis sp. Hca4]
MRLSLKKTATTATVLAAMAAAGAIGAPAANAADQPTVQQLMQDCGNKGARDLCVFHPSSGKRTYTPENRISGLVANCSTLAAAHQVSGSHTWGTTKSWSVTASADVEIAEVVKVGVSATYGEAYTDTKTTSAATTVNIPPRAFGWISQRIVNLDLTGTFEIHYGSRKWGHYFWYVNNAHLTGPIKDNSGNVTVAHTRAMTAAERRTYCGS